MRLTGRDFRFPCQLRVLLVPARVVIIVYEDVYFRYFLRDDQVGFFLVGVVGCDDTVGVSAAGGGSGITTFDRFAAVVAAVVDRLVPVLTDMMRVRGVALFLRVDVAEAATDVLLLPTPLLSPSSSSSSSLLVSSS
jgi:hypothetical protein